MVLGAEGWWVAATGIWVRGTVGWHEDHTACRQAWRVGAAEPWLSPQRDGERLVHNLGKGIWPGRQGRDDSSWLPVGQVGSDVPRAAPLHHVYHPTSTFLPAAPAPQPGLARPSMPHGMALAPAMAGCREDRAHPTGPARGARGGTPGFWGRQDCTHRCGRGVHWRAAGLGLQAAQRSGAAAMWPVCVWAAGRVGEKEGEEAAEAAAPLISSFLNTFKPWC